MERGPGLGSPEVLTAEVLAAAARWLESEVRRGGHWGRICARGGLSHGEERCGC